MAFALPAPAMLASVAPPRVCAVSSSGSACAQALPRAFGASPIAPAVLVTALTSAALARRRRPGGSARSSRLARRAAAVAEPPTEVAAEGVDAAKEEFVRFLFDEVLEVQAPDNLSVLLAVFQGSGYEILGKDEWKELGGDMHPFLLPLAVKDKGDDNIEVIGLLPRTPNGSPLYPWEYQVVSQKIKTSMRVKLVAFSAQKYIMKRSEEANFRQQKQDLPVIAATKDMYEVQFKGTDKNALDRWLLLEVGAFPDVYINLSQEHIEKGDPQTGLIIADTMRDAFGTQWAFPHAYCCRVLRLPHFNGKATIKGNNEDRELEADHSAHRAFTCGYPLWTLEEDGITLEDLIGEAKMPKQGSVDSLRVFYLRRAVDEQRASVRTGSMSLGCAAVSKAQALMDAVVCGHKSYQGVRKELADLYEEVPGCEPLMQMIEYFRL